MKNISKALIASSIAALSVSIANAGGMPAGQTEDSDSAELKGYVVPYCDVDIEKSKIKLGELKGKYSKNAYSKIKYKCNDWNGAKLTLTSANKGLYNSQITDPSESLVGYDAMLKSSAANLTLKAINGTASVSTSAGNKSVAKGIHGKLEIKSGKGLWAGEYTDTLTLEIKAI